MFSLIRCRHPCRGLLQSHSLLQGDMSLISTVSGDTGFPFSALPLMNQPSRLLALRSANDEALKAGVLKIGGSIEEAIRLIFFKAIPS
jgi:hypothetical protein